MTTEPFLTHTFSSEQETSQFAQRLALRLHPGDVMLLQGGIGAGKTHFSRAFIQARLARNGTIEDVPSPTFTLVQTYDDGGTEIWHADLYRLTHPDEVDELGLIDAFETAICLVEWPDRLGELTPSNALLIDLNTTEQPGARIARFSATDPVWLAHVTGALT